MDGEVVLVLKAVLGPAFNHLIRATHMRGFWFLIPAEQSLKSSIVNKMNKLYLFYQNLIQSSFTNSWGYLPHNDLLVILLSHCGLNTHTKVFLNLLLNLII